MTKDMMRINGTKTDLVLPSFELSPIAKSSDPLEDQPARSRLVQPGPGLVLGGVRLHDLVVEPGVRHRHPVLGEGARLVRADR